MKPFYIQTKECIDRVFTSDGSELLCVPVGESKMFNGMAPPGPTTLRMLSDEGTTEMPAREVFSASLAESNNFVVVNDHPNEAKVCMIEFTPRFSRMMGIPKEIELIRKSPGELKKEWNMNNQDLFARGVDPTCQVFIATVQFKPEPDTHHVYTELGDETVIIKLYGSCGSVQITR